MIPGSQYAFGTLVISLTAILCFWVGIVLAKSFEIRKYGKVRNAGTLITIFLFIFLGLMYSLSPVYISLIKWAAAAVKGG